MKNKQFALRLRKVRKLLEASQEQMAKHLGMSIEMYRELENGAKTPNMTARAHVNKRVERLLEICGLETEKTNTAQRKRK
jgi:DNA-binding XRE family transcriptional regulator